MLLIILHKGTTLLEKELQCIRKIKDFNGNWLNQIPEAMGFLVIVKYHQIPKGSLFMGSDDCHQNKIRPTEV